MAAITEHDLITVRRLLQEFTDSPTMQAIYNETEYVARRLGDISRLRAARLITATRQNKTTADVRRQTMRARR